MAQVVKLKRSATAGKVPGTVDMVAGEMAMNTADGKLFLRDDSDVRPIVTVNNQVTGSINLIGNITASGNISASSYYSNGFNSLAATNIGGTNTLYVGPDTNIDLNLYGDLNNTNLSHRFTGNITASGNISASGQFIGTDFGLDSTDKLQFSPSTLQFRLGDNSKYTMTPTVFRPTADEGASLGRTAEKWKELVVNHITASGNISASGDLSINGFPSVSASLAAATGGGGGNVSNTGTPLDNQIAIWTNANTIEGRSDFTFDSGQMVIDALTGVVINDGNNDAYFQVKGSSDNNLLQVNPNNNDRIGIGTSTPSEKLTVQGNISASGNLTLNNILYFTSTSNEIRTTGVGATNGFLYINPDGNLYLGEDRTDNVFIGRQDNTNYTTRIFGGTSTVAIKVGDPYVELNVPVTASSDISASGNLYANNIVLPIGNKIGVEALDEVYINFSTSNFELTSTTGNVIIQGQGGVQIGTPLVNNITEIHGSISASYFGGNHIIGGLSLNIEPSITASIISASGTSDNFFGGRLVLDNSTYFAGSETSGTSRNILGIDNSNITQIANANLATNIKGTSITASNNTLIQGTLAIDGIANVSASIAAAGGGGGGGISFNGSTTDGVVTYGSSTTADVEPYLTFNGYAFEFNAGDAATGVFGTYVDLVNDIEAVDIFNGDHADIGTAISTTRGYVYNLSGSWAAAQANSPSTSTGLLGLATQTSTSNTFLLKGYALLPASSFQGTFVAGQPIYINANNSGRYAFTPPSAGNVSRIVGHTIETASLSRVDYYKIYFNPSAEWIET